MMNAPSGALRGFVTLADLTVPGNIIEGDYGYCTSKCRNSRIFLGKRKNTDVGK